MLLNLKKRLTPKITRKRLAVFLEQHRSETLTLEIGAKNRPYRDLFPNTIAGDIAYTPTINLQLDAHTLPFGDASFSMILCTEVLEHCMNPHQVISEFYRVLKPGGKLILTTRFIFPLHDVPYDYFRFTKYGLRMLCSHFKDVSVIEETATVETIAVLLQRLIFQSNWRLPLAKIGLQILSGLAMRSQIALKEEFGDISKTSPETGILASGYYVVATR